MDLMALLRYYYSTYEKKVLIFFCREKIINHNVLSKSKLRSNDHTIDHDKRTDVSLLFSDMVQKRASIADTNLHSGPRRRITTHQRIHHIINRLYLFPCREPGHKLSRVRKKLEENKMCERYNNRRARTPYYE